MKRVSVIILLSIQAIFPNAQEPVAAGKLAVEVNYNVEVLGLAYFIGFEGVDIENKTVEIEGKNIPKKEWHKYGFYIYEKYKKYATSEKLAKSFAVADHLWLDYIINLLIQVDNFPRAQLRGDLDAKYFINFSVKKDTAEAKQNAGIFLDGLNSFYEEINFKQYIIDTKEFYTSAVKQVKKNLPGNNFVPVIESFYRKSFQKYILVPSLTIPKGMGFGLNFTKNGKTTLFNVFGAFELQAFHDPKSLDLGFGNQQRLRELSIHEFGHSFVNPVIDSIPQDLVATTERLFEPIKPAMEKQGYNTWKASLYEHFVRAGEVVIAKRMGDLPGSKKLYKNYVDDRQFTYLPEIIEELENYTGSRYSYFDAVMKVMHNLK